MSSSSPTTVPRTEAEMVSPQASITTVIQNPATPASPPTPQYSSSWTVRRVSGALRMVPATRRMSSPMDLLSSACGRRSGVAAGQYPGARGQGGHRVQAQYAEAGPGRQAVCDRLDRGQGVLRDEHRHVLPDRVLDRGAQRDQDQRQHEQNSDHGADRACGVPDDRAKAKADERD